MENVRIAIPPPKKNKIMSILLSFLKTWKISFLSNKCSLLSGLQPFVYKTENNPIPSAFAVTHFIQGSWLLCVNLILLRCNSKSGRRFLFCYSAQGGLLSRPLTSAHSLLVNLGFYLDFPQFIWFFLSNKFTSLSEYWKMTLWVLYKTPHLEEHVNGSWLVTSKTVKENQV